MKRQQPIIRLIIVALATFLVATAPRSEAQTGIERKTLLQQDLAVPGYETRLLEVTIPAGMREGKHFHPGTVVVYVLEGELTVELEKLPTKIVKAGESLVIAPGQVHEGINNGSVSGKLIATFIVEKGKPLTTPAQ